MTGKYAQAKPLFIALLLVLLAAPVTVCHAQQEKPALAIVGAGLIDATGAPPIENAVVLIREGLLECAGSREACAFDDQTRVLDATGKWLVPGFIDSHMHWQIWFDENRELSAHSAARAARVYLANGITTLVDVGGQRFVGKSHRRVLEQLQSSGQPAPRMLFSAWIDRREVDQSGSKDAGAVATGLLAGDVVGIKIHNGLAQKDYELIVAAADRVGRPVYGHTYYLDQSGFVDRTNAAASAGVDGVFHVLGIPPVAGAQRPPLPAASMDDWQAWWLAGAELWLHASDAGMDALVGRMIRNDTWLQPTLITEQYQIRPGYFQDHPAWAHSPVSREDLQTGLPSYAGDALTRYRAAYTRMQQFVRKFSAAGGLVVAGTDGFPIPGFGMQEEMRLLAEAGMPLEEVLQAATRNAALALRWQDRIGTLQKGKLADLVILSGNPLQDISHTADIWRVIQAGAVYDPGMLLREPQDPLTGQADSRRP